MEPGELSARLRHSTDVLLALRPAVVAGEPWPQAMDFGVGPEAAWEPPEVLAHLYEMLPYWLAQMERILAGGPEPAPFGRVATDEARLAGIARDRALPPGELFDRIAAELVRWQRRLTELNRIDLAREGLHPALGVMTVGAMLERTVVGHVAEHVVQLQRLVVAGP